MQQIKKLENLISLKMKAVDIGDRCRVDMGDIENLALSMDINGLIYPIIVSLGEAGRYNLIEGERRMIAAKSLGWTQIDCILLDSLPILRRRELEIIMCVQRKQLDFAEESRAVRDLVELRRQEALKGGLSRASTTIRNKDVAMELNIHESRLSECLRIAEAIDQHPELELECKNRSECLRRIRKQQFHVPDGGYFQKVYEDNFIFSLPVPCLEAIEDKVVDLIILQEDNYDEALLTLAIKKLKIAGQLIIFGETRELFKWEEAAKAAGLYPGHKQHLWVVKDDGDYISYIWVGKNRRSPIRPIPPTVSYSRPEPRYSSRAKPKALLSQLIKSTTDKHGFVVVPRCEDIDTVRCCVDIGRNIRAACPDRMMLEKLILSVTEEA